jgi:hypothetical protein
MKKSSYIKFLFIVYIASFGCNPKQEKSTIENKNNVLYEKILDVIKQYNIVFYKDYDLLSMKGTDEIQPSKLQRPFVMVANNPYSKTKRVDFKLDIYRQSLYTNMKKVDSFYIDLFQYYLPPLYAFSFYYPHKELIEEYCYSCDEYTPIYSHLEFSDSVCILDRYVKSYKVNDTIFYEEFTFDCCNYKEPSPKERTTFGKLMRLGNAVIDFKNTPELAMYELTKYYEKDEKLIMEYYYKGNETELSKKVYDKNEYISLNWIYALKIFNF